MLTSLLVRAAIWAREKTLSVIRKALLKVLAAGPVPKHVAFVMDGNRRYARSRHLAVQRGHSDGFLALQRVSISL
jgi:ditrans,polycis-polyprenyl diphosphate synthase